MIREILNEIFPEYQDIKEIIREIKNKD